MDPSRRFTVERCDSNMYKYGNAKYCIVSVN